jgi:hypothetical protein
LCALLTVVLAAFELVAGVAHAEDVQPETQESDAVKARPQGEARTPERRRNMEQHQQSRREWWAHARDVLFTDIDLGADQSEEIEEIIEAHLENRTRGREVTAELRRLGPSADAAQKERLRDELREVQAQRMSQPQVLGELREQLTDAQRPTFDMNRARLVAEGQSPAPVLREEPATVRRSPSS